MSSFQTFKGFIPRENSSAPPQTHSVTGTSSRDPSLSATSTATYLHYGPNATDPTNYYGPAGNNHSNNGQNDDGDNPQMNLFNNLVSVRDKEHSVATFNQTRIADNQQDQHPINIDLVESAQDDFLPFHMRNPSHQYENANDKIYSGVNRSLSANVRRRNSELMYEDIGIDGKIETGDARRPKNKKRDVK